MTVIKALTPAEAARGKHSFEIDADGKTHRCEVDVLATNTVTQALCDGMTLSVGPVMEAVLTPGTFPGRPDMPVDPSQIALSRPVAGRAEWRLVASPDLPVSVCVKHSFKGKLVSERTVRPAYAVRPPGGTACEPGCKQATETLP